MPATSRKQFRLMKAVESGAVKLPGLSPAKAAEFTAGQSSAGLPEQVKAPVQRKQRRFRVG